MKKQEFLDKYASRQLVGEGIHWQEEMEKDLVELIRKDNIGKWIGRMNDEEYKDLWESLVNLGDKMKLNKP